MKTLIAIIIILVIVALGLYFWLQYGAYSPLQEQQVPPPQSAASEPPAPSDSTQSITQDIDSIDLGDLNKDFEEVNRDIEGL